jgi:hypothetical protein
MLCPFSFQRPASPESRGTRVLTPALDLDFAKEGAEWLAPPNTGAVLNTVIRLGHRPFLLLPTSESLLRVGSRRPCGLAR